jgi:hypothetical protein
MGYSDKAHLFFGKIGSCAKRMVVGCHLSLKVLTLRPITFSGFFYTILLTDPGFTSLLSYFGGNGSEKHASV